ncbi:hypothetical protein IAT40_004278 [Kwoniella sp. CBS 6097]
MYTSTILSAALSALAATASPIALAKRYTSVKIQSYSSDKCLTPQGEQATWTDGTAVTSVDCADAARWDISPGSGSVLLQWPNSTVQYALDAGTGRDNNEGVKIWTSYPTLFQQTWYLTDDNRIAITGGDQCLDEGVNGPQTYQCTTGNTNQVWAIVPDAPTASTTPPIGNPTVTVTPTTWTVDEPTFSILPIDSTLASDGPVTVPGATGHASSVTTVTVSPTFIEEPSGSVQPINLPSVSYSHGSDVPGVAPTASIISVVSGSIAPAPSASTVTVAAGSGSAPAPWATVTV